MLQVCEVPTTKKTIAIFNRRLIFDIVLNNILHPGWSAFACATYSHRPRTQINSYFLISVRIKIIAWTHVQLIVSSCFIVYYFRVNCDYIIYQRTFFCLFVWWLCSPNSMRTLDINGRNWVRCKRTTKCILTCFRNSDNNCIVVNFFDCFSSLRSPPRKDCEPFNENCTHNRKVMNEIERIVRCHCVDNVKIPLRSAYTKLLNSLWP